jgi:acyl-CoA reductase-like NAD-dependent aldehyde dehydrogenase
VIDDVETITADVPLKHPNRFFIGGEWVAPSSDAMIDVICPATEQLYFRVAEAMEVDAANAVAAARTAFDRGPWPRMSPAERGGYLRKLASGLRARVGDFADIWSNEMGVANAAARAMTTGMADVIDYYAGLGDTFPFITWHKPEAGEIGMLVREPVGVVTAIIPWNAPLNLMIYKVAPALLAGCTLVIKASPEAPGEALAFAELVEEAGLPAGVVNVITADRAVSESLVRNPDVDKVSFTGSTAAGRRIASICGERIARFTLELGGKSAAVILDDYDVGKAAETISGMASLMTGQVCSSLTRIVVTQKRHDEFLEALGAAFSATRVGDPFDAATQMGPLAMKRQRDRVEMLVGQGRDSGATLATGGGRPAHLNRGYYFEPTVFGNVDNGSIIAREEIFGPVLGVIPARDERHAVEIANDSVYGLNASVFTNDVTRAYAVARELRSGTVGQNSFRTDFSIAFGGFKQSGIGREGGEEGLLPYLEAKTVILDARPPGL